MSSPETRRKLLFYGLLGILALLAAGVQSRMPPALELWGGAPDLVLAVAVASGLLDGPVTGGIMGLAGGYLLSSQVALSPGSLYFSHILVGYLSGLPRSRLYTDNWRVPLGAGLLAGAASEFLFYLLTPRNPCRLAEGMAFQSCCLPVATFAAHWLLKRWHQENY